MKARSLVKSTAVVFFVTGVVALGVGVKGFFNDSFSSGLYSAQPQQFNLHAALILVAGLGLLISSAIAFQHSKPSDAEIH